MLNCKMIKLIRYWFDFELNNNDLPLDLMMGCGVTAYNYSDALNLLKETVL